MAQGIAAALDSLKGAVGDLSSLEVHTYVGEITVKSSKDAPLTRFEDFLEQASNAGGDLKLKVVTKMNFDGDTINLVPADGLEGHVKEMHESSVRAGIEARKGLIELFKGIVL